MPEEPGATSNAFGLDAHGTPEPDFLSDYTETPETRAEPEATPEPQIEEPTQPEIPVAETPKEDAAAEPQATPPAEEPQFSVAAPDFRLPPELVEALGGRFAEATLAEFVAAYRNGETWNTRTAQEAAEFKRRSQELASKVEELGQRERMAAPLLNWLGQQIQEGNIDAQELTRFAPPPETPQPEQPAVNPYQLAQQQAAVQTFSQAHPEAVTDPQVDAAMTRIIKTLRYDSETGTENEEDFPITHQNLEIAYTLSREPVVESLAHDLKFIPSDDLDLQLLREASQNPGLYQQLKANPIYLETTAGHQLARQQAQVLSGFTQAQQQAPAAAQAQTEEMKRRAHVERGGSGAPGTAAPGKVAPDDMDADQLWDAVRERAQSDRTNVFGI